MILTSARQEATSTWEVADVPGHGACHPHRAASLVRGVTISCAVLRHLTVVLTYDLPASACELGCRRRRRLNWRAQGSTRREYSDRPV